jgi:hypothetical protein
MFRFVFPVILLSGICFADLVPCAQGDAVVGGSFGTLPETLLTSPGLACSEGALTFENFTVQVTQALSVVPTWGVTLGPPMQGSTLSFLYPQIPGDDVFLLDFRVFGSLSGIDLESGPDMSVEETVCAVPFVGAVCPAPGAVMAGVANGGEVFLALAPAASGLYYVSVEVTNGSGFANVFSPAVAATPEPATLSLVGGALIFAGIIGPRRSFRSIVTVASPDE